MRLIVLLIFLTLIFSCAPTEKKKELSTKLEEITAHFSVKDSLEYTILEVKQPFVGANLTERYVLYPRDKDIPQQITATHYVPVPVERVAINSTTHLGFINAISEANSIKAASNLTLYYDTAFQKRIEQAEVVSIGERAINSENLIHQRLEVLFSFAIDAADYKKTEELRKFDQNVILISEYMEQDPLKKAEWIKFFAAFYGDDASYKADSIFKQIKEDYLAVKEKARNSAQKPTVLIGLPWKGTWYVSGGDSFQAKLIEDANGDYLWKDKKQEASLPLDIEVIYQKGISADVWINPGTVNSKTSLIEQNEKFTLFNAVQKSRVYTNYKKSNSLGANDYWESAVVRPDLILSDLYSVFHTPENINNTEFYKPLEE